MKKRKSLPALRFLPTALVVLLITGACNLEQDIQIELPPYESQIVVECYLEPGEPYRMLLSRSSSFFAPLEMTNEEFFENLLVDSATAVIRYQGQVIKLENRLQFDPEAGKLYNYVGNQIVPDDTVSTFELLITTADGEVIRSKTTILPVIPIDSLVVEFDDTDSARVLTYFTDPDQDAVNNVRRLLQAYEEGDLETLQDFVSDDRFVDSVVVFGTAYEFAPGDTVINTLYHIKDDYFNYLQSVFLAIDSNGNPFGQPSPVISNVESEGNIAIGIFAGLTYDRRTLIIESP